MAVRANLLLIFLVLNFSGAQAETKYPVGDIPEDLTVNANAVVRENLVMFTIISRSKATLQVRFVATILNSKASQFARLTLSYDKLKKITQLGAATYDASGKQIRKLKSGDVYDHAAFDGFSLYVDDRLKSVDFTQSTYPFTVEFTYEIEYKYLYSIPGLEIVDENSSVQHAVYQLIYPVELRPRHRVLNWESTPVIEKRGDKTESILWTFDKIKPIKFEPNGPHHEELRPQIIAAPSAFEYDGYGGDMSSWKEYGKWNALLGKGRDVLPEATKLKVKALTKDLGTTEQKAKVLYEYLQSRTRYVSIQLGIGGLQPFPASLVDEVGYGDCKALSNYMVAMLKEAGIIGYYTIIQAGDDEPDVILDFPSHQSNHVIVAVPDGKDTLWMECTSQTKAFGYMGRFTGDRTALMITEAGGMLVRTPTYSAEQNTQLRTADVTIDALGNAKAKVKTTYNGIQTENGGLDGLLQNQFDDQKKWIQSNTDIPSFTVNSFSITGVKSKIPSVVVTLNLTLSRYASVSSKRLFLTPNLMNRSTYIPEKVENRKSEVVRYSSYTDMDTVNIILPDNLYPEFLPQPMKIASRFGEYESTYQFGQGKVVFIRRIKMWKGHYPKETYGEFIDFYKNVNKSDNVKLVLLSKT